jgi:hypothetical protein
MNLLWKNSLRLRLCRWLHYFIKFINVKKYFNLSGVLGFWGFGVLYKEAKVFLPKNC